MSKLARVGPHSACWQYARAKTTEPARAASSSVRGVDIRTVWSPSHSMGSKQLSCGRRSSAANISTFIGGADAGAERQTAVRSSRASMLVRSAGLWF